MKAELLKHPVCQEITNQNIRFSSCLQCKPCGNDCTIAVKKNGNAPIIARITIDQVVAQFNTKLEINPAHWSVKLGKASGRTAEAVHINSMLESIHSTVPQQD